MPSHSWIVVKEAGANAYTRYDYTAWGDPIRVNGFAADGRWFGDVPQIVAAADGDSAAQMIPKIRAAITAYKPRAYGDYRAWPGPNSNTFVAAALAAVPELQTTLPPTAIGKDFPFDGSWFGLTPSRTGVRLTLGGYLGLTAGWVEGFELNILGGVIGFDLRHPAIKLPALAASVWPSRRPDWNRFSRCRFESPSKPGPGRKGRLMDTATQKSAAADRGVPTVPLNLTINGKAHRLEIPPWVTLLDLVRERLHLSGTKKGCNQGACGACTMLVDGERIVSCLALAVQYDGRSITTIEGLAKDGQLHPLQQAFIEHDGFQCGYCTPGQICSAVAMAAELARGVPSHVSADLSTESIAPSRDELAERMSGNLCRCGAHNGIIDAIAATFVKDAATHYTPYEPEVAA